jgi:hypothetical protein
MMRCGGWLMLDNIHDGLVSVVLDVNFLSGLDVQFIVPETQRMYR